MLSFDVFQQVSAPNVVVLDWIVEEDNDVSDMMTSILKPQYGRAEAVEPPTSLENLLQAYVEEEQLTGANQWRYVDALLFRCLALLHFEFL